jgi:ribose transport system substrate-binding protein
MNFKKKLTLVGAMTVVTAFALAACSADVSPSGGADGAKEKIYINLSYSGNNWQDEGANLAMAVAQAPEVAAKYDVQKVISGSDPQKQISDLQSMIASGAKLIVLYPISPTALNPVIQQGCDAGVTFVAYDGTVEAPCAWNISYITGARTENPEKAFFGAQTAQALVDLLGGTGEVMMNRGVAGTSTDTVHYDTAMSVFNEYPGIEVVNEFYGNWDSSVSQQETAKALAAHPGVDGIWSQAGEDGVIKALEAAGMEIPVTGENSNYLREKLSAGWPGVSSGSAPAQGGVAVKLGLKILADGADSVPKDIEMPLPWVTTETAKVCPDAEFVDGCNFFSQADDSFVTEIFEKNVLPESSYTAATTGAPVSALQALPSMDTLVQPESRRIYTRGVCDAGWTPGPVEEGQVPAGLPGCVKE